MIRKTLTDEVINPSVDRQKISHVRRLVPFCTYNHGMARDVRERVFTTISGVPVDEVYTPESIAELDYDRDL